MLRPLLWLMILAGSSATFAASSEAQLQFTPLTPVVGAATRLTITGMWPDNCPPVAASVEFSTPEESTEDVAGVPSLLRVLLRLPSTFQACLPNLTSYALQLNDVQFATQGDYRVELVSTFGSPSTERIRGSSNVRVAKANEAVSEFAFAGLWYERRTSGSGLALTQLRQARRDVVFGTWHNYRSNGSASWFALQGGGWETPRRYRGDVYAVEGMSYGTCAAVGCGVLLPAFPANRIHLIGRYRVDVRSAARAELVFEALPGQPAAPIRVIELEKLL
jgi:hypothetical protein